MFTRKLIDFFLLPEKPQPEPSPNAGPSPEAEFAWPPSAEDLEAFSVVHLRADDGSELAPVVVGFADVA